MSDMPGQVDGQGRSVAVERTGAVAVVVLAGRDGTGTLDLATKAALRDTLRRVADDSAVRAVVLTGTGSVFCLGQDLHEHAAALADDATRAWDTLRNHFNPIATALATMPKPVIAAVNGTAAGAGMSLALACDLRVAAPAATFHVAFPGIGLSVDTGMSWFLPRLIGYGRAMELLLRPRPISAAAAAELGLVTAVAEDVRQAAVQLAEELADGPTVAYGAIKQALLYSAAHGLPDALDLEAGMQTVAGITADHAGAVQAFLRKQKPRFEGR
ncbi:Enoyl-CoA hydratase [Acidothermus cellulolyticus 11B]|uniref:Enoyl-CoA hydratase n=1 Tax=Acidothermus cellulolyticus (strain ATCC 43068 / DSM 8971 / 11B) TaxID=351607 RepID=A0LVZ8_ACIC1|nr:enoyl-CoA hydratase-related protein [Acidothermus cellulolyticus]ABK53608.1 Enoyl-CoA hydratase [Acidothermus cellulolyticus 11B]